MKKPLLGEIVLENHRLLNVHNMDDDGISKLKTEIELLEQNN